MHVSPTFEFLMMSQTDVTKVLPPANVGKLVVAAFTRYAKLTFPHAQRVQSNDTTLPISETHSSNHASRLLLHSLNLVVESDDESHPELDTNESYTLQIPDPVESQDGVVWLRAATVYGALHGLESFSQLV
jgi:hypothetical protein